MLFPPTQWFRRSQHPPKVVPGAPGFCCRSRKRSQVVMPQVLLALAPRSTQDRCSGSFVRDVKTMDETRRVRFILSGWLRTRFCGGWLLHKCTRTELLQLLQLDFHCDRGVKSNATKNTSFAEQIRTLRDCSETAPRQLRLLRWESGLFGVAAAIQHGPNDGILRVALQIDADAILGCSKPCPSTAFVHQLL